MSLNSIQTPLTGFHFVEASAGTGKTYYLCQLFFQQLIEKKIPYNKILLVTFTNLAAEDLKDRIYQYLEKALNCIQRTIDNTIKDPLVQYIVKRCEDQKISMIIENTFLNFCEVHISTIDSFWYEMINEYSFEMNNLIQQTLIDENEQKRILEEIINRMHYQYFSNKNLLSLPNQRMLMWQEKSLSRLSNLVVKK